VEVLTPRTLDEALRLKAARPEARPIAGGTDLLVELNFDRTRPETILNLAEVPELKGWSRENGTVRLGAGLTYTEAMQPPLAELLPALAEASRTVGSPQIRNRGTIGGNLGTASPAGDALPPLLVADGEVEVASVRGTRRMPVEGFLLGVKRNALEPDELIVAARVRVGVGRETFMKVGRW
jgi:CO/xanthine dehydrogenase FAD-binding subunit